MQVGGTLPPWISVSSWLSSKPYSELVRLQVDRERLHSRLQPRPGLTFYAYSPYAPNPQPIFRIGGFPGVNGARLSPGSEGAGPGWERFPLHQLDPALFAHPGNDMARLPGQVNVEWVVPSAPPAPPPLSPVGGAGGLAGLSPRAALRAWLFGSALVVLVVVLVRAIDKCLDLNLLKSRRRSQEWPTPSVRATSRQAIDNSIVIIPEEEISSTDLRPGEYNEVFSVDLPPPYSECLRDEQIPDPGGPKHVYEEPPPAYNDTYVEFSNKNGVPSVVIYSRRRAPLANRQDIAGSQSENNEEATNVISNTQNNDENDGINAETNPDNSNQNVTMADGNETSEQLNFNAQVVSYVVTDRATTTEETTIDIDEENNGETTSTPDETNGDGVIIV